MGFLAPKRDMVQVLLLIPFGKKKARNEEGAFFKGLCEGFSGGESEWHKS